MDMDEIDPKLLDLLNEIEIAEKSVPEKSGDEAEDNGDSSSQNDESNNEQNDNVRSDAEISGDLDIDIEDNSISDFNSLDDDFDEDEDEDDIEKQLEYETEVVEVDEEKERIEKNIIGLLDQHCESAKAMFNEAEVDRKKIDDIVNVLLPKIENDEYRGSDIMALSSLIQTKADISKNRASNMDSIAKLFAALKNNDRIAPGAGSGGNDDDISNEEIANLLSSNNK